MRTTLNPPAVDPADPPTNINIESMRLGERVPLVEIGGHVAGGRLDGDDLEEGFPDGMGAAEVEPAIMRLMATVTTLTATIPA